MIYLLNHTPDGRFDLVPIERSAVPAQPALTSFRIPLSTGVHLHFVARGLTPYQITGRPIDHAILMIPGLSDSWRTFTEMLDLMPPATDPMPVFALDMRGHGRSSWPDTDTVRLDDYAADVAAFLEARSIGSATIVGHSMGGLIAQKVAERYPSQVARLVLISTVASMAGHPVTAELKAATADWPEDGRAPLAFVQEFQVSTFHEPISPIILDRYVSDSLRLINRTWKKSIDALDHDDRSAHGVPNPTPTLIVWGEADAFFNRAEQEALAALFPNSRLVTFPGAGHALNVERAAQVVHEMGRFLGDTDRIKPDVRVA